MAIIAGVDGCREGWICITKNLATGIIGSGVYAHAKSLFCQDPLPDIIAIDIPIGLTEKDPRQCDKEARKLLGSARRSSVFPAPIRPALGAKNRFQASKLTFEANGRKVGAQSWNIFRKIREIDDALKDNLRLRERAYEVHPEVCFWALNHGAAMEYSKKTPEGRNARRQLVCRFFGKSAVDRVRSDRAAKKVKDDDIYDAFAALWTAQRISKGKAVVIPDPPPLDSTGLCMGMWY